MHCIADASALSSFAAIALLVVAVPFVGAIMRMARVDVDVHVLGIVEAVQNQYSDERHATKYH